MNQLKKLLSLLLTTAFLSSWANAQDQTEYIKFAIVALDTDNETRILLEDRLVQRLVENNYEAVTSHSFLPQIDDFQEVSLRSALYNQGFKAALIIRPIDLGEQATIDSVQEFLTLEDFTTMTDFVRVYRGDNINTQAVIHIGGFVFDTNRTLAFWQGVMWLDETVENQEDGIEKIVNLVEFNLNHYRSSIRDQLGLPALDLSN